MEEKNFVFVCWFNKRNGNVINKNKFLFAGDEYE